jgi:hypothetical protein
VILVLVKPVRGIYRFGLVCQADCWIFDFEIEDGRGNDFINDFMTNIRTVFNIANSRNRIFTVIHGQIR